MRCSSSRRSRKARRSTTSAAATAASPSPRSRTIKAKKGLGIDFNPERLKDCQENLKKLPDADQKKLEFKQGDVLKMKPEDFKDVDVVTLYLLPEVNLRLKPILQKGLKPGSRIVSHAFDMGDWKADKTEAVKDDDTFERTIYLWTIKKE